MTTATNGSTPPAQFNALKHGGRITRLTLGELPKTMARQTSAARRYRRELELVISDAKGEVDLHDAHLIDEACSAEVHASVCRWLLREKLSKMTVQDVVKCSQEILKAKTIRNRAVDRLGLRQDQKSVIDCLYIEDHSDQPSPAAMPDDETAEGASNQGNAAGVKPEAQEECEDCEGQGCPSCRTRVKE